MAEQTEDPQYLYPTAGILAEEDAAKAHQEEGIHKAVRDHIDELISSHDGQGTLHIVIAWKSPEKDLYVNGELVETVQLERQT